MNADELMSHSDELYRFALFRLQNKELSEDLVQETIISAWKSRDSFLNQSSLKTWLISILKRKIIDYFRSQYSKELVCLDDKHDYLAEQNKYDDEMFSQDGHWLEAPQKWAEPSNIIQQRSFLTILEQCLERLNSKLASVFIMKEIDDEDSENICKELNISASNLWVLLYRARMNLRQCIEVKWSN
ncbi:MAG: hypothetical protein RLZZ210_1270 [Pseudomonadota bacterium]|jgi:RNA polymerase sigma-70 factor (ECF subfamily)